MKPPLDGTPPPSLLKLFSICFKIGITSFGGGLSGWLFHEFVTRNRWLSEEEFVSSFAVSQMLPGANAANLIILLSNRLHGVLGVICAMTGFLIGPFFTVIALFAVYQSVGDIDRVGAVTSGVTAAALGLILVICVKGVQRNLAFPPALLVIAATALPIGLLQWPLIPVVLVVTPISVALAWKRS